MQSNEIPRRTLLPPWLCKLEWECHLGVSLYRVSGPENVFLSCQHGGNLISSFGSNNLVLRGNSPPLCIISTWKQFNHYSRIVSFGLGVLAGSGSQLVGSVILESPWFAVDEIHEVSTWEEQGIDSPYVSLSFRRGSFSEHLHWLRFVLPTLC